MWPKKQKQNKQKVKYIFLYLNIFQVKSLKWVLPSWVCFWVGRYYFHEANYFVTTSQKSPQFLKTILDFHHANISHASIFNAAILSSNCVSKWDWIDLTNLQDNLNLRPCALATFENMLAAISGYKYFCRQTYVRLHSP